VGAKCWIPVSGPMGDRVLEAMPYPKKGLGAKILSPAL
jgi:hypothetical protein